MSSPPLDLLNLFRFHFSMGVPNGRSIFKLRPDQGIVGGLSHSGHFCSQRMAKDAKFLHVGNEHSVHTAQADLSLPSTQINKYGFFFKLWTEPGCAERHPLHTG